jgi:phosphoribosylglycinamide formyltransferase-1
MKRIVIFASGSGTNAENLIRFFHNRETGSVIQVLTNNPRAQVLERAKNLNVSALSFNRIAFSQSKDVLNILKASQPDLIVLAGFLWKFPDFILNEFPNKAINIHPALLPKYGGKGMYGSFVHQAVVTNKDTETGITIHYVNEHYDEGAIIFQAKCEVNPSDTADDVASKIHELEMEHFPKVIEELLKNQKTNSKTNNTNSCN